MNVSHSARVLQLELKTVLALCEGLGTVRSLTVALLLKYEQWDELLSLTCVPDHYESSSAFADDYLVTSILQKNPRLPTGIDKKAEAIRKFHASELKCKATNLRLSEYQEGRLAPLLDVHRVIHNAREIIRGILGQTPTRADLDYVYENCRFGPGATTSLSGVVTQGKKYSLRALEATPRVASFRVFGFPEAWKGQNVEISLRSYSKLVTVPKNAKTDRVICIEPDLNIFVQLGFGALIREKLRRAGLDLNTQEVNRDLASKALELDLCTLDLSAASDTISRELVWLLLPYGWASALEFSRVDSTSIDGEILPLEKWSSMGNGYTFELESLIFWAISLAACEAFELKLDRVKAYGDDLIFPAFALEIVVETLDFLGFSVNHEKTFGKGRFRESCGTDWFDGQNVRPVFFRSELHDFDSVCFLYANSLRRYARHRNGGGSCDVRLLPAWLRCFSAVRPNHRFQIPEGFGDGGFISSFDEARPSIIYASRHRGWAGFSFRYRQLKVRERVVSVEGAYLAFLNGVTSDFTSGREGLRGRYDTPLTSLGYVLSWPNLGPWA